MKKTYRCTGRPWVCLLLLFLAGPLLAQTPESLLAAEEYAAAAQAFSARGARPDHLAAGEAWLKIDSFDRARDALHRAVAGASDSLSGLAWHKIGLSHYYEFDDAAASTAYLKAIAVRDRIFPADHLDRAHTRSNLAGSYLFLGKVDSAGLLLREAIDIYAAAPQSDTLNWLRSLIDLMNVSVHLRDYQVGVSSAAAALDLEGRAQDLRPRDRQSTFYSAALTYLTFSQATEALPYAQKALAMAEDLQRPEDVVQSLNLLAAISDQRGRTDEYIAFSERAVRVCRENDLVSAELGLLYFNLARAYGAKGNLDKAFANARLAEAILVDAEPDRLPGLYSVRGSLELQREAPAAALVALNHGLSLLPGARPLDALPRPLPDSLEGNLLEVSANLLGDRAKVLALLGRPTEALQDYALLFTIHDLLRGRVSTDASRRYLSNNLRPFFDRAIDLHVAAYRQDGSPEHLWRAFHLSERAKAYSLLTALQRDRNSMPKREAALRARIAELERQASANAHQNSALEAARLQLDRLLLLDKNRPVTTTPALPDKDEMLALLRARGSDLIAYHLGQENGHRFILRHATGGIEWAAVTDVATLGERVERWRAALVGSAFRRKSLRPAAEQIALDRAYLTEGLALSRELLKGTGAAAEKVIIVPDGALNFLPFAALPLREAPFPLDYAALDYFQRDRQINYAYSVSFLVRLAGVPRATYASNVVAFAPVFRGDAAIGGITRASLPERTRLGERAIAGLRPLRHNREEVEAIAGIIPGTRVLLAADADRAHFLELIGQSRILHLSTHGMVDALDPGRSFVAFSQLGDSLELEEMLYFNDLYALPLNVELAVLSACETSLGQYLPGETALSLASAFAAAGARSTLTTLWQVDDAATKDLMVSFYQGVMRGLDRGAALAEAQEIHRRGTEYAHPYYWAAVTLYGESDQLELSSTEKTFQTRWIGLVGLVLGLCFMVWRRLRFLFVLLPLLGSLGAGAQDAGLGTEEQSQDPVAVATAKLAYVKAAGQAASDTLVQLLQEAVAVLEKAPAHHQDELVDAYVWLADKAAGLRNYDLAESALQLALPTLQAGKLARGRRFQLYLLAAGAQTKMYNFEASITLSKKAVELASTPREKFDALNRYAYGYLGTDDIPRALTILEQAVALADQLDAKDVARVRNNLGILQTGQGDCAAALRNFTAAIEGYTAGRDRARCYLNRSQCYLKDGDRAAALREVELALREFIPTSQKPSPLGQIRYDQVEDRRANELILTLLSERGRLLFGFGRAPEAIETYAQQYQLLKLDREGLRSENSRRIHNGINRWAFDRMVSYALAAAQNEPSAGYFWDALWASDLARAYSLQLTQESASRQLSARETELLRRIAALERGNADPRQLSAARLELEQQRRLRDKKGLADLAPAEIRTSLQDYLRREAAELLVYHVSDTVAFALHIRTDGQTAAWRIATTDSLFQLTEAWRSSIQEGAYRKKSLRSAAVQDSLDAAFLRNGRALATMLLPERLSARKLVVIPDGPLNFLPFAALPLEEAGLPLDYRALAYLHHGRTLHAAFSVRSLLRQRTRPPVDSPYDLVAFAPEFSGKSGPLALTNQMRAAQAGTDSAALPGLLPLQFNREEVKTIARLVGKSRTFLGEDADRAAFLTSVGSARIVHLSSHGMVNTNDPNLSFLAFSQRGDSLNTEELLYYNDLYSLPLDVDLAVLSACETSLGQLAPGEMPLTLASAFAEAGARSTLTSLWQVDDAATMELMVRFYQELTEGKDRVTALTTAREAQLKSEDFGHPYYWAAMSLQGDEGPLSLAEPRGLGHLLLPVAGVCALLLAIWAWFRRRPGHRA
ncbi:CHAT domain-containing protein [Neolewinella lacunae]|uniref:CHAT domain-containing protein n=1 Tax=Neolewinella lacunae TaxID=1517758 RepID=A0A923PJ49_9BACT|nr:CHAT domain-containing protein [Neolewinella lacunae]MBC6992671.1 CHAT domain-containing protein [Neolewinella lacunae]MDN3633551.1 CHAT domain-containing protein [Neolewinella lacunae]